MRVGKALGGALCIIATAAVSFAGVLTFQSYYTQLANAEIRESDQTRFEAPVNDELVGAYESFLFTHPLMEIDEEVIEVQEEMPEEDVALTDTAPIESYVPTETLYDRIAAQDSIWGDQSLPSRWYRANCSGDLAAAYDALEQGFRSFSHDIRIPLISASQMVDAFDFVLADNPDIFWVGLAFNYRDMGDGTWSIDPDYDYSYDYASSLMSTIDAQANEAASYARGFSGQYAQAHAALEWIVTHTSGTSNPYGNQDVKSVFVDGVSCCAGYSHALQYVCQKLGIPCIYIYGEAINNSGNNGGHAWVGLCLNGTICYADPLWADAGSYVDDSVFGVCGPCFAGQHRGYAGIIPNAWNERYEIGNLSYGL